MDDALTYESIMDAMNKLGPMPSRTSPSMFSGLPVYTTPPPPPKIQLSEGLEVGEQFRKEFNAWLITKFGYKDPLLDRNTVMVSKDFGFMLMRPETLQILNTTTF